MTKIKKITYEKFGEYSLAESDAHEGSLLLRSDFLDIVDLPDSSLDFFKFKIYDGKEYITVTDANKVWKELRKKIGQNKINNVPNYFPSKNLRFVSFDELLIRKLLLLAFPSCSIQMQVPIIDVKTKNKYIVDLRISLNGETKNIEFMGPQHFIQFPGRNTPEDPIVRKNKIKAIDTPNEVIIWPYWIARCKQNAQMIFKQEGQGFGALWSTNYLFGDFCFPNSAAIIQEISQRFNAWDNDNGVCAYYLKDSYGRRKTEHPIIDKIKNGEILNDKLIPKGAINHSQWVPKIK